MSIYTSGLELLNFEFFKMSQFWAPNAENRGTWHSRFFLCGQRLLHATICENWKKIKFPGFEQIGIEFGKNLKFGHLSRKVRSPTSLRCKLEIGESCAKFFCCRLMGPSKEITGMGIGYQLHPTFCTGCSKLQKSRFVPKVAPSGELRFFTYSGCLQRMFLRVPLLPKAENR